MRFPVGTGIGGEVFTSARTTRCCTPAGPYMTATCFAIVPLAQFQPVHPVWIPVPGEIELD
jgi:hypothetical protein